MEIEAAVRDGALVRALGAVSRASRLLDTAINDFRSQGSLLAERVSELERARAELEGRLAELLSKNVVEEKRRRKDPQDYSDRKEGRDRGDRHLFLPGNSAPESS